jgi:hypothetical protein
VKPSPKWPIGATLFCFLPFLSAVAFRGPTGIFTRSHAYLKQRLLGALAWAAVVWITYGFVWALKKK